MLLINWLMIFVVLLSFGFVSQGCTGETDPGVNREVSEEDDEDQWQKRQDERDENEEQTIWRQAGESLCESDVRHQPNLDIPAGESGRVQACLPGEAIDASAMIVQKGVFDVGVHVALAEVDSISFDTGKQVSPAVRFSAVKLASDEEDVLLHSALYFNLPMWENLAQDEALFLCHYEPLGNNTEPDCRPLDISFDDDEAPFVIVFENEALGVYQLFSVNAGEEK